MPASVAVAGLTAEQAKWSPGNGQHSVGQLAYHLWFWDARALEQFNGVKPAAFSGNNDETFNNLQRSAVGRPGEEAEPGFERLGEGRGGADDKKLAENASLVAHVGAHNAYHMGRSVRTEAGRRVGPEQGREVNTGSRE